MSAPRVVLTHAYSATNAGDGLLVTEAVALVRAALPGAEVRVVALDPESFDLDGVPVVHPLTASPESLSRRTTLLTGARLLASPRRREAHRRRLYADADLVVAVGGGYLRGKSAVETVKFLPTHLVQMPGGSVDLPVVYLPQSIGPFHPRVFARVRAELQHAAHVFVRDDRSLAEVALPNVRRLPDMAVLGLPDELAAARRTTGSATPTYGLVARALEGADAVLGAYDANLRAVIAELAPELLVQANARGNDDAAFYRDAHLGEPSRLMLDAVRADDRPDVVVSVRLHGAVQAIRAGVPAVHLSYERKGWGAYEDLGIGEFVHNVFDFDSALVARQARALAADPSSYWGAIDAAVPGLRAAADELRSVVGAQWSRT